ARRMTPQGPRCRAARVPFVVRTFSSDLLAFAVERPSASSGECCRQRPRIRAHGARPRFASRYGLPPGNKRHAVDGFGVRGFGAWGAERGLVIEALDPWCCGLNFASRAVLVTPD